ncbi:MAG: N-acetylneuraminate synthase family protein [Deltaproteobacteria bacterium]|jgi:sialic acid synthase SpsE|nr:N-acetylneuraminate synthase family protein [Deltaproteobacteria bacterium]
MDIFKKAQKQGYFLIAEIGVNYYDIAQKMGLNLIDAAKLMIDKAKESGLDAVKFQSYKAEKLASKYSPSYWDTKEEKTTSQFELFKKYDSFGYEEYKELALYCREKEIVFLSTPFDFESADYLEELVPVYKISSSDITNVPFIRHIAGKNKPILLSTGASNLDEIKRAVDEIKQTGTGKCVLMHCVLEYPTPFEHANLNMISSLKEEFPDFWIGYSDHTRPDANMDVLKTAWILGAVFIEKHFSLDKFIPGNDHYHSMDFNDAVKLTEQLPFLVKIRGESNKKCLDSEKLSRLNARRSIVAGVEISAGDTIERKMLVFKRPGTGISPDKIDKVIGKIAKHPIKSDEIFTWDLLD